jgi:hypothetical protein
MMPLAMLSGGPQFYRKLDAYIVPVIMLSRAYPYHVNRRRQLRVWKLEAYPVMRPEKDALCTAEDKVSH